MEIRTEGASLLLDKLEMITEGQQLKKEDVEEILNHQDIQLWLKAYDWIDSQKTKFKEMLNKLHDKIDDDNVPREQNISDLWKQKIDYGLREVIDNPKQMLASIEAIKNYDWDSTVKKAINYLPDETELDPVLVVTVDGFNGGMFRYGTVYLSLVYFDASVISKDILSHELHHMGAEYWWEKDSRIQKYKNSDNKQMRYIAHLFTYLVGEGIANAFCSPQAITELKREETEQHDKMVKEYQEEIEDIFDRLEELLEKILECPEEGVSELYSEFTMDKENKGIPQGHFLSGKMVQVMDQSYSVSQDEILNLIKNPFDFLQVYNKAAEELKTREFSKELIKETDDLLKRLEIKKKENDYVTNKLQTHSRK